MKQWKRPAGLALLIVTYFVLGSTRLFGQANVGAIGGTVRDASGAVIAGATVTLLDPATNEKHTQQTNDAGDFIFNSVRPSTYTVSAQLSGFRTVLRENVIVGVAQKIAVDFALDPGVVTETVEVKGGAPLLEPTTSSLGTVIADRTILDLPLSGRNVFELVKLAPGTSPNFNYGAGKVADELSRIGAGPGVALNQISINGGRNLSNEFLLDDVPNTTMGFNGVAVIPPLDAVQEFNVLTNSYSAKYGRSGGGFITVVTRSGSNAFHGTLWEFHRNDNLDANFFFSNKFGGEKAEFKQNQFGVTAGGPIQRDKTFFFGSYEGFRQIEARPLILTVPTAAQKAGDFTGVNAIYDPFSTRQDPNTGGFIRDQFLGCDPVNNPQPNVICSDRFDPVAQNLSQFFPDPNQPGTTNNYFTNAGHRQVTNALQGRIDHNFSDRSRLFGRFNWDEQDFNPANVLGNVADFNNNPFLNTHRSLTLSYTNSLTPTTILNVRYGALRERQVNSSSSLGFDVTEIGFPAALRDQFEEKIFPRFDFTVGGYTSLGPQFFSLVDRANTTQSLAGNLSKVIGRHSIEAGFDLRLIQGALFQPGWPTGQFAFDNGFSDGPDPLGGAGNGNAFASFLLGTTSFGEASYDPHWFFTEKYYAFYFQDDIKISPKLTLNLGLRYDYETPLEDRQDQLSFLDFSTDIPINPTPVDVGQGLTPEESAGLNLGLRPTGPFRGGAGFPGVGGAGKGVTLADRNDWGPRVGLAYSIDNKTVIRTAYGIIYPGTSADNVGNFPSIVGYNPQTATVTSPDGLTPFNLPDRAFLLSNPFPNGLRPVDGATKGVLTNLGDGNSGFIRNERHAYYQQWNFGIQRELPGNLLVEVAYVGSHSVHLADFGGNQFNVLPNEYLSLGASLFDSLPNPFFGITPPNSSLGASDTITRRQLLLPYPYFTGVTGQAAHRTSSTYNGIQVKMQKRMSQGLSILGSYTFSKMLNDASASDGPNDFTTSHQDLNNLALDHALDAQDRSQILVISSVYELPFGRGRPIGGGVTNPAASHLISGWEVSSIWSFATGFPLAIGCAVCEAPANRPNLVGNPSVGSWGAAQNRLDRYFNVDAFATPTPFTYGNSSRTLPHTRGPGQANVDLSIIKNSRFAERYNVQFRAEFFNLANRPEFAHPDRAFGSPTFGVISRQINLPRQIQFGLKLYW